MDFVFFQPKQRVPPVVLHHARLQLPSKDPIFKSGFWVFVGSDSIRLDP